MFVFIDVPCSKISQKKRELLQSTRSNEYVKTTCSFSIVETWVGKKKLQVDAFVCIKHRATQQTLDVSETSFRHP